MWLVPLLKARARGVCWTRQVQSAGFLALSLWLEPFQLLGSVSLGVADSALATALKDL